VTLVVFAFWEVIFLISAQALITHPRVVTWGEQHAKSFAPWIYVALGVLILVECGTLR
jgi:cadmium resistance protein CadD (predicted permease)